ncbi:MAG: protein TolR [Rickettsiella sp.]|nr:protein TolR [Rickettsiella sp.]
MLHNRLRQSRRGPLAEINVVPYIDVMLVLLVIFMVTTPLLSQGVKVNLPKAQAQTITQSQEPLIVSVNREGQLYLNTAVHPDMPITEADLSQQVGEQLQLAEQKKMKRQIFVKADKDVNYGKVVNAMVLLQKVGAVNIGLVTESTDKQST